MNTVYRDAEEKDIQALKAAFPNDVVLPNFVVEKDGKIIGYSSMNIPLLVSHWINPFKDFLSYVRGWNQMEKIAKDAGADYIAVPVKDGCEVGNKEGLMQRRGYVMLGRATIWIKQLN